MGNYYLIGCGGIGGWLASALVKTLKKADVLFLMDGDKLEEKNIDRQLFSPEFIGCYKTDAMKIALEKGARCHIESLPEFLGTNELFELKLAKECWVMMGVDNQAARVKALAMCDKVGVNCISASNGYEEAEAFIYKPEWIGTALDPRVYYPEILTDKSADPLKPPCTGEILDTTPQLAIANMSAAAYAMWLLWYWREKYHLITDEQAQGFAPVHVTSSAGRVQYISVNNKKGIT